MDRDSSHQHRSNYCGIEGEKNERDSENFYNTVSSYKNTYRGCKCNIAKAAVLDPRQHRKSNSRRAIAVPKEDDWMLKILQNEGMQIIGFTNSVISVDGL